MKCKLHYEENCSYCESQDSSFLEVSDYNLVRDSRDSLVSENTRLRQALEEIRTKFDDQYFEDDIGWMAEEIAKAALEVEDEG